MSQMPKLNEKSTRTKVPPPVRVTLDLKEVLAPEELNKIITADQLIIDGAEFLSKDRAVLLATAFAQQEGYIDLKAKHEVLKNSFNKVYAEYKQLSKETEQYKRLNRTFLQKVKDKIKK